MAESSTDRLRLEPMVGGCCAGGECDTALRTAFHAPPRRRQTRQGDATVLRERVAWPKHAARSLARPAPPPPSPLRTSNTTTPQHLPRTAPAWPLARPPTPARGTPATARSSRSSWTAGWPPCPAQPHPLATPPRGSAPSPYRRAMPAPLLPRRLPCHQTLRWRGSSTRRHAGYSYSGPAAAWAYKSADWPNAWVAPSPSTAPACR